MKDLFLTILAVACVISTLQSPLYAGGIGDPSKKGIALTPLRDQDFSKLSRLNVTWFYNWKSVTERPDVKDCFVPIYMGKQGQLSDLQQKLAIPTPVLLTFNEPDFKHNRRSVSEALSEWPSLQGMATRISAPSPLNPLGKWMKDFMEKAEARGYKTDFVPVHWYGPPDAELFLSFLEDVHQAYRKPLWITEFAILDRHAARYRLESRFTQDQVIAFLREVLPALDRLDYVERYAWVVVKPWRKAFASSQLFNADGSFNKVGEFYADYAYRPEVHYCDQRKD